MADDVGFDDLIPQPAARLSPTAAQPLAPPAQPLPQKLQNAQSVAQQTVRQTAADASKQWEVVSERPDNDPRSWGATPIEGGDHPL
jgi:hypothetical protein